LIYFQPLDVLLHILPLLFHTIQPAIDTYLDILILKAGHYLVFHHRQYFSILH
jgi:hypothetical protein